MAQFFEEGIWEGNSFRIGEIPPWRVRQLHDDIKTGTPAFKQHRQGMAAVALRLAGATYSEIAETLTFAEPSPKSNE